MDNLRFSNQPVIVHQSNKPVENAQTQMPKPKTETTTSSGKKAGTEDESLSKAEASLLQKVVRKGLIESKHDIEVQRKDPTSPLYSVKTFEALHL